MWKNIDCWQDGPVNGLESHILSGSWDLQCCIPVLCHILSPTCLFHDLCELQHSKIKHKAQWFCAITDLFKVAVPSDSVLSKLLGPPVKIFPLCPPMMAKDLASTPSPLLHPLPSVSFPVQRLNGSLTPFHTEYDRSWSYQNIGCNIPFSQRWN